MTKEERTNKSAYFLAAAMLIMDDFDELQDCSFYSKQLKLHGNRFIKELQRKIEPIESNAIRFDDIGYVHNVQDLLENILKNISTIDYTGLVDIANMIHVYIQKKDEESINS